MTAATEEKTATPIDKALPADPMVDVPTSSDLRGAALEQYREERAGGARCGASNVEAQEAGEFVGEEGGWSCTRAPHPSHWQHIATSGRYVIGRWSSDDAVTDAATEPDPEPFTAEIGNLYRLRGRQEILMLIGFRKADSHGVRKVEVLDLSHKRFRLLKLEQLIPRADDGEAPTAEAMAWVAKYMAKRRSEVREVAMREFRNGRYNRETLNSTLLELGLEPSQVVLHLVCTPEVRMVLPPGIDQQEAKDQLLKAFREMPLPEGWRYERELTHGTTYYNFREVGE